MWKEKWLIKNTGKRNALPNGIERACALCEEDEISAEDVIPLNRRRDCRVEKNTLEITDDTLLTIEEYEKLAIQKALKVA